MRTIVTARARPLAIVAAAFSTLAAPPAHAETRAPIIIVGVDGMTFDVIGPLVEQGRLPNLEALMEGGATAILQSERPMRSPALWTTIATGRPRAVHRIFDFVTGSAYWPKSERDVPRRLVTSDMRRAPALWELAGRQGKRSLIVGWLNTWPAEDIEGLMVAPYVALGAARQTSIKGKIYDDVERQTFPAEAFAGLRPLIVSTAEVPAARIAKIVDVPPHGDALYARVPQLERYLYTARWSIAGALTNTAIIEKELASSSGPGGPYDLIMTYFDGADTLAHRFWVMRQSVADIRARLQAHGIDPDLAPELKRRLGFAVDGYYELIDEMLGRLRKAAGPSATFVLVSDHGWGALPERGQAPQAHVPFDGEHRLEGIFIANGPAIRAGRFDPLSLYEIAPTTLYALGTGVPPSLDGRVAMEIFVDSFVRANPPLTLATRNAEREPTRAPSEASVPAPFREREMERLRSLGYVQ